MPCNIFTFYSALILFATMSPRNWEQPKQIHFVALRHSSSFQKRWCTSVYQVFESDFSLKKMRSYSPEMCGLPPVRRELRWASNPRSKNLPTHGSFENCSAAARFAWIAWPSRTHLYFSICEFILFRITSSLGKCKWRCVNCIKGWMKTTEDLFLPFHSPLLLIQFSVPLSLSHFSVCQREKMVPYRLRYKTKGIFPPRKWNMKKKNKRT